MQFRAFEPGIEVNGQTVYAVVDGFSNQAIPLRFLAEVGIAKPISDSWYPQQAWLDAFKRIGEEVGDATLFRIGQRIPENAVFPPNVSDIHSAMQAIDVAYHLNHRKAGTVMFDVATGQMLEGIGHYGYTKVGDRKIHCRCETPYSSHFDLGIITALARRFEKNATCYLDETKPTRLQGAGACTCVVRY